MVFGAINERRGALRELIVNSKRTFEATASRDEALAETFAIFPTFLDESKATMARLEDFSRSTHPLVNDLKGPADDLGPTVRDLGDLAPDLERLFRDLGPLIRESRTGVPALERTLREAEPLTEALHTFFPELNPILSYLNFHQQTIAGFITNGGADLAADYGTGQRGQTQIGIISDSRSFEAYPYGDAAAGLGARQRLPPAERARPRAGASAASRASSARTGERKYAEDALKPGQSHDDKLAAVLRGPALALRRPHLPVPAQGRRAAAPGAARVRRQHAGRRPRPERLETRDNPAMPFLFGKAYRRMGKNYFLLYVVFEFVSAFIVCLATVGLFALYTDPSSSEFWTIAAFAEVCVALSTASCCGTAPSGSGRSSTGWRATAMRSRPGARRSRCRAS